MIRREVSDSDGKRWLLIHQKDHARLAGQLAESWGASVAGLDLRKEMLAAVYCHDDGWTSWDESPKTDADSGRPLSFSEMPQADSLSIWRESIRLAAERLGPLEAFLIAGHFSALLKRFDSWRGDPQRQPRAEAFFGEFSGKMNNWLRQWQAAQAASDSRSDAMAATAEKGVLQLQMFDAISLWLCCSDRYEPHKQSTPFGFELTLAPAGSGEVTLTPWPLTVNHLGLSVTGRSIPIGRYSDVELRQAVGEAPRETICWEFRREMKRD